MKKGDTLDGFIHHYEQRALRPHPYEMTFTASDRQRAIGMISLESKDDCDIPGIAGPWIATLFVHPFYRSLGIGKTLVRIMLDYITRLDLFEKVYIFVSEDSLADFYRRLGWTNLSCIPNPYLFPSETCQVLEYSLKTEASHV